MCIVPLAGLNHVLTLIDWCSQLNWNLFKFASRLTKLCANSMYVQYEDYRAMFKLIELIALYMYVAYRFFFLVFKDINFTFL